MTGRPSLAAVAVSACLLAGCGGVQSALAPAGVEAAAIARLTWWLFGGAVLIWSGVMALAIFAARSRPGAAPSTADVPGRRRVTDAERRHETRHARRLIIGGGVVFPVLTLALLLLFTLRMTPPLLAADGALTVDVTGEQWWWRVRYRLPDGSEVDSANEVRLPAGRRTSFHVEAADVIHSFWIPVLGGKIDMIPGRTNVLTVEPTAPGVYRGVCAELCGASHALMAFDVVVMEADEFDAWLRAQAQPATAPAAEPAVTGQRLFRDNGCGACHRIRGTDAIGLVGPDLTHVGSRLTIGAGTLPADVPSLAAWIEEPAAFKPGVQMPSYHMLGEAELGALAAYLEALR
ncbi:MAG: cytochrome c oxidase subunit II [Gammaproteobacteria bacterium]|nr:cytochrome c oxidase subunit II [Gammaproteobacteria bacterium]